MQKTRTTLAAVITLAALGALTAFALRPPDSVAPPAAAAQPVQVRTVVIRRTIRIVRHEKPPPPLPQSLTLARPPGPPPNGADRTGPGTPSAHGQLEAACYGWSLADREPASLVEALAAAPVRRSASPNPAACSRQIEIDEPAGLVRGPPGLRIDSGGVGKGLTADTVALRLSGYARFVVDCGGDLAVGGVAALVRPHAIEVEHPLTGPRRWPRPRCCSARSARVACSATRAA